MKLTYFGHSFWLIETQGKRIAIDPFDDIGYQIPTDLSADCVAISHDHHDHNNTALIKGNPVVIKTAGLHEIDTVKITLLPVFHDEQSGKRRGINHLIKIETPNLTLLHCGDLGHLPAPEICQLVIKPDLLFIPVGEIYTLSLKDAWKFIEQISPTLILPMHYNTIALRFNLGELDTFIGNAQNVIRYNTNSFVVTEQLLSAQRIIVPNWKE